MKRLCFLLPDVDTAHGVVDDLRGRGIGDADIYVVANDKIELGDLPDAGNIEKSDFYPQLVPRPGTSVHHERALDGRSAGDGR